MELGGCAPFIVTADADIEAAADAAMVAKFRNGGQACTAANILFIHESRHDQFVDALTARLSKLWVGPAAAGSDIGPLISPRALQNLTRLLDTALAEGGVVAFQSSVLEGAGYFFPPTLLTGVRPDSSLVSEEIFGPVAPVVAWNDLDALIDAVNASELGLASYVIAGDIGAALKIAERLETGMVGINRGLVSDPSAPFGGAKQSGIGREGARAGIEELPRVSILQRRLMTCHAA